MTAPATLSQYNYLIEQGIKAGKRKDISDACVYEVVYSHNQLGGNYQWLGPLVNYSHLLWIDFYEEKYGKWITYGNYAYARHGALVSHHPDKLVSEHVRWYVGENGKPPKIHLRFWFQSLSGHVFSMAPTREFYELEREYFIKNHLCHKHPELFQPKFDLSKAEGPQYLYEQKDQKDQKDKYDTDFHLKETKENKKKYPTRSLSKSNSVRLLSYSRRSRSPPPPVLQLERYKTPPSSKFSYAYRNRRSSLS